MTPQEGRHRTEGVPDVPGLRLVPASGAGVPPPGVPVRGPPGFQFGTNPLEGRRRCPCAPGEDLPPLLLLHGPVIARSLHPAGQGRSAGWQENPALRCGQDLTIGCTDGVRERECATCWIPTTFASRR